MYHSVGGRVEAENCAEPDMDKALRKLIKRGSLLLASTERKVIYAFELRDKLIPKSEYPYEKYSLRILGPEADQEVLKFKFYGSRVVFDPSVGHLRHARTRGDKARRRRTGGSN
ncbi:hypothetical protein B0H14DRAFT_2573740 [Mycena olivaceomarginata]|nr:hypothetical protein B0H14DRAFT_2573740 [Mycena olivaceomarginata]